MAPFPFLKNIFTEKTYLLYLLLSVMQLLNKFRHYSINFIFLQGSLLELKLMGWAYSSLCREEGVTLKPSFNLKFDDSLYSSLSL